MSEQAVSGERTNEELADALRKYSKHLRERRLNTALMDEIIARLRANDGERIEGWARVMDPNCSCAEARQWGVDVDCGHYDGLPSYRPCTLILHNPKGMEADG